MDSLNFNSVETLPNLSARAAFQVNSSAVFKEDVDIVPVIIDDTLSYMPWGGDNNMPFDILKLIEDDETLSTCQMFNAEVCFGSGLRYDTCLATAAVKSEVEDFFLDNDIASYYLGVCLPSTVKTIDVGAFDACSNLAEFHIRAVTPPVAETGAFGVMFPNYKMNLYVPVGALDAYKAAPEWDDAFLTYNEEGEQTGVEDVAASKQVASVEYYSVSGIKNAEPVDGVNIKVVRYTDGSLQTSKFVK